ncbi:carbamoyltransferase HypF [Alkalinema pantanalense CENA528]|uniref:carbamoyltransferase HypF n=1 Tax=Alkalinema pantanalense TaxID=1620705 RepID=UPI003D6E59E5
MLRQQLHVAGIVQGIGFRPFVYQLATTLGLTGWVQNDAQGAVIEVEGPIDRLQQFHDRLQTDLPSHGLIQRITLTTLDSTGDPHFEIRPSQSNPATTLILPDLATCPACLRELFDPNDRRYRYPFINCTHCGPRYSIIQGLPYDRPNTTMRDFVLCDACRAEYENPRDRRFHAQPIACPHCGPQLALWDRQGNSLVRGDEALLATVSALRQGNIVAIKGLGGFQLLVDAYNSTAIAQLRQRKHRPDKPFALMYPSLTALQADCPVSDRASQVLTSAAAPIVLLPHHLDRSHSRLNQDLIAPQNPYLGVMLPYTPLHHLLMAALNSPVIATSGNLAGEPICIDEWEAVRQLGSVADYFLVHDRAIARPVDDSVVRLITVQEFSEASAEVSGQTLEQELMLRRARGYAPLPITLKLPNARHNSSILAVGGHLKSTIAITIPESILQDQSKDATAGNHPSANQTSSNSFSVVNILLSQHLGNLDNWQTVTTFHEVAESLQAIYGIQAAEIICDLHPDYFSTQYAQNHLQNHAIAPIAVQHHHAHIAACMAEHQLTQPVLGIAWDGTGYGTDGTLWGGEFMIATLTDFQRLATFEPFRLLGGEQAVREPRRIAIALLYELFGSALWEQGEQLNLPAVKAFTVQERSVLSQMLQRSVNCPMTSSVGRLFDGVASLLDLIQVSTFEGQAAMAVEFACGAETIENWPNHASYSFDMYEEASHYVVNWKPIVQGILQDLQRSVSQSTIALKFHQTLVDIIVAIVQRSDLSTLVLSGGCFQNKWLLEQSIQRLHNLGYPLYWPQKIPPNDGGIALGQAAVGLSRLNNT